MSNVAFRQTWLCQYRDPNLLCTHTTHDISNFDELPSSHMGCVPQAAPANGGLAAGARTPGK